MSATPRHGRAVAEYRLTRVATRKRCQDKSKAPSRIQCGQTATCVGTRHARHAPWQRQSGQAVLYQPVAGDWPEVLERTEELAGLRGW